MPVYAVTRRTPRRTPPAICYGCGKEIEDVTVTLYGSFCSGACAESVRRASETPVRPDGPWTSNKDAR